MKNKMRNPLELFKASISSGSLIKSWRINFEIPQAEMAFACGISQANLSAIENGRREIGSRTALRLSAFMDLSPEIILYPNGFQSEPEFKEVEKRAKKLKALAG